jgi:hypothetical protein
MLHTVVGFSFNPSYSSLRQHKLSASKVASACPGRALVTFLVRAAQPLSSLFAACSRLVCNRGLNCGIVVAFCGAHSEAAIIP